MAVADLLILPPVVAHRGVRSEAPENTLAAFKKAREQGILWIETDIKLTHDGIPIVMHDNTLNRTTSGKGPVADMPWADMRKLDAGSWFNPSFASERIMPLAEVLRYTLDNNMRINLELKPCPGRTQATVMVTLIEAAKIWPHDYPPPLISSFDIEALVIASRLHPDWPRGLLLDDWHEDWRDLATKAYADTIHIKAEALNAERVRHFVEAEMPVLAYTVNDPLRAKELLHWGVRAVFSDNPKEIVKAL